MSIIDIKETAVYKNNKNNYTYYVENFNITNATNANDGQRMVLYKRRNKFYVREYTEFLQKFTFLYNEC